ncbi:MAG: threonylcarbamoyl-AMP synthase [Cyclobacteriaceae bacterium]
MAEIGQNIEQAKNILDCGGLVAIPTETVYGLAANALNRDAVVKIFEAKNRPSFDPLISHVADIDQITNYTTEFPAIARKIAADHWPGPLTILLPKKSTIPDLVTSGLATMAIRVPRHELTHQLLTELTYPLAAPSANPFGYVSPTTAQHVNDQLGNKVDYILDGGPTKVGLESTIISFDREQIIAHRLGGLALEELKEYGSIVQHLNQSSNPIAPGMLKSHYSPGRKLIIGNIPELIAQYNDQNIGVISFTASYKVFRSAVLSERADLHEAGRNIFAALRLMDDPNIDIILTELMPDEGLGRAINDRLRRASVS